MKKYNYQAKTFEEAKSLAMAELMEQQENLFIREIESVNKLFNKTKDKNKTDPAKTESVYCFVQPA